MHLDKLANVCTLGVAVALFIGVHKSAHAHASGNKTVATASPERGRNCKGAQHSLETISRHGAASHL